MSSSQGNDDDDDDDNLRCRRLTIYDDSNMRWRRMWRSAPQAHRTSIIVDDSTGCRNVQPLKPHALCLLYQGMEARAALHSQGMEARAALHSQRMEARAALHSHPLVNA
ncbi:hypothetical protein PoB_002955700 [Plakobranchus ocellatus]|uniref:Uncharacterized protein n=1 Tax=Plakobranchus ocellatus TaxID=259542 RepID=A0AAV4A6Y5_9GAST|nr:hypothetical protein PoB_002955700 [Plakobranchus ocellatus]